MGHPQFEDHRLHLEAIRQAAMDASDAGRAVANSMRLERGQLQVGSQLISLEETSRVYLVALGKAAPAMSRAAASILGERLSAGIATLPRHRAGGKPDLPAGAPLARVRWVTSEHPLPGPGSLRAGQAAAELLAQTTAQDLVLALVSGGGSALMELPLSGIGLADLRILNRMLLASGMPIQEINRVRKAISRLKAGGLARLAAPAQAVALILSDVVGDRLGSVASGPTVLQHSPAKQARQTLERHGLWQEVPPAVRQALLQERIPRPKARRPINVLVGSNRQVVLAASRQAEQLGFSTKRPSFSMQGEARVVGERFGGRLIRADPGTCLLMGGETTVSLHGSGLGGRNQELALAAALQMDGFPGAALLAFSTDGVDGPTDAAGAMVDGSTASAIRAAGIEPKTALNENDSHPALEAAQALIRSGPSGTNLNDLVVGLRYSANGAA